MGALGGLLVIIVIMSVIWIISNVIRAQQEVAQQAARRNAAKSAPGAKPAEKHTAGDIESFLQEIERLRRRGQDEKTTGSAAKSREADRREADRPQPPRKPKPIARRTIGDQEQRPRPRPKLDRPITLPAAPLPPVVPELMDPSPTRQQREERAERADRAEQAQQTQQGFAIPRPAPAAPESQSTGTASAPVVTKLSPLSPIFHTPADQLLQVLLHSRQGPAVAILVQEIFGPPKCRKK